MCTSPERGNMTATKPAASTSGIEKLQRCLSEKEKGKQFLDEHVQRERAGMPSTQIELARWARANLHLKL